MNVKGLLHLIAVLTLTIGGVWPLTSAAAPLANPPPTGLAAPPPDLPASIPPGDTALSPSDAPTSSAPTLSPLADNPDPPVSPVKLIFIHHSTGGNWLADPNEDQPYGGLGGALRDNNYFVSATNYGWGPIWPDQGEPIGNYTDIPNWPIWFTSQYSSTILNALYTEYGKNEYTPGHEYYFGSYSRMADPDPTRENEIIMFKSCFPNSDLYGDPEDPPGSEPNDQFTVSNAKAVYNNLLTYFETRQQDKLFIVITAPPMAEGEYIEDPYQPPAERAANARAFNNWLVNDWLDGYPYNNVAVFDYYNVLTSNGSATRVDDPGTNEEPNDTGWADGNHHRWSGSAVEHMQTVNNNYSAYPTDTDWDSHPTTFGHQKATEEFVLLLNVFYNRWQSGTTPAPSLNLIEPNSATYWPINSSRQIRWSTSGTVTHVNLAYSIDGVTTTIESGVANTGVYAWTTPPTPTTSARVRVESVVSPTTVYDVSAAFTLYTPSAVTATVYLPLVLGNYTSQPPSCPHPLSSVSISGPSSGSFVLHTFTAVIAPSDATPPVTYAWSPAPASGQGTASASYQWDTAGTYAITLVAENCGGPVTDSHTITISDTPPITGLTALHRSGQTFLTWNEDTGVSGEGYHVYRHTAPITAGNIDQARSLTAKWGPLPEGSSIFYTDRDREPGENTWRGLRNYVITGLGQPLTDTIGLFVWTSKEAGNFYYAVTTVQGAEETLSPENSLTSPVAEIVADPEPVLVWESASGNGRVYTQFMDFATFNPTFERPYAHPDGGLQYAYNYWVGLPTTEECGGPVPDELALYLHIEGYGSRYADFGSGDQSIFCAVEVWGDDPRPSWYFGFSATYDYRTGDPSTDTPDTGPIVNYTEERLLRSIYDTLRDPYYADYNIDEQRIYVYGHSMGGSGALALAMRYPNIFAASYSSEPMTNYRTSGDGGGTDWREDCEPKWGTISANLPISNVGRYTSHLAVYNGTGVWDWQNHQANLADRAADEMAYITLGHGTLDNVIEWSTQAQPVYAQFYAGRRAFAAAIVEYDHTWLGFEGLGPNFRWDEMSFRRDETIPALSNASSDLPVPPTETGGYNQALLWSSSWNDWDGSPVDQADRWQISLCAVSPNPWINDCGTYTGTTPITVDVTPRRVQAFTITPGASYAWENRRVSDNSLVDSGTVIADADRLVTVPNFAVSTDGNRLILQPSTGIAYTLKTVTSQARR